jgi:hypothetical protein
VLLSIEKGSGARKGSPAEVGLRKSPDSRASPQDLLIFSALLEEKPSQGEYAPLPSDLRTAGHNSDQKPS